MKKGLVYLSVAILLLVASCSNNGTEAASQTNASSQQSDSSEFDKEIFAAFAESLKQDTLVYYGLEYKISREDDTVTVVGWSEDLSRGVKMFANISEQSSMHSRYNMTLPRCYEEFHSLYPDLHLDFTVYDFEEREKVLLQYYDGELVADGITPDKPEKIESTWSSTPREMDNLHKFFISLHPEMTKDDVLDAISEFGLVYSAIGNEYSGYLIVGLDKSSTSRRYRDRTGDSLEIGFERRLRGGVDDKTLHLDSVSYHRGQNTPGYGFTPDYDNGDFYYGSTKCKDGEEAIQKYLKNE